MRCNDPSQDFVRFPQRHIRIQEYYIKDLHSIILIR